MVEHAVLGKEGAHHLPCHYEWNEQRPPIEPAQDRHRARIVTQREVAPDGNRDQSDQNRRREDDRQREQEIGGVEIERLGEMLERESAVLAPESNHRRHRERRNEEDENDRQRRSEQRK